MEIKLDSEQINAAIVDAVMKSSIAPAIEEGVAEFCKNFPNEWDLHKHVANTVRRIVHEIVDENLDHMKPQIKQWLQEFMTEEVVKQAFDELFKAWMRNNRSRY